MITRDLNWGIGHHVRYLSKELVRLGFDVNMLTSDDGGLFANPNLRANMIAVMKKDALKNCDIIHVQGSPYGAFLINSGKPVITTVHTTGLTELRHKKSIDYVACLPFEFMTLRNSDALIAINDNIAEELKNFYKIKNKEITIIHNGFELDEVNPRKGKEHSTKIKLLSGGRLEKRKGFDILIKAMKIISELHNNVELKIFGEGPEHNRLIKLIQRLNISDKVTLTGFIQRDKLIELYRCSDIFVLGSLYEGDPITLIEAMSAGLAVLSSKIPSVKNLVIDGQTGLLFNAGDPHDLASKLSELINNDDLRKYLMLNTRKYANQKANWKQIALETIKVYKTML